MYCLRHDKKKVPRHLAQIEFLKSTFNLWLAESAGVDMQRRLYLCYNFTIHEFSLGPEAHAIMQLHRHLNSVIVSSFYLTIRFLFQWLSLSKFLWRAAWGVLAPSAALATASLGSPSFPVFSF